MTTRDEAIAQLTAPGAPFELSVQDIRGAKMKAYAVAPFTFADMLRASRQYGDKDWFIYQDERYSFEQNYRIASGLAHELINTYGIKKGDRVAIALRNYPEFVFLFWAVTSIGAVLVPLNAWWTADELAYGIQDSGAVFLAADRERITSLKDRLPGLGLRGVISIRTDEVIDGVDKWDDVKARFDPNAELPDVDLDTDDMATILYTSGTTGQSRGAIHTHRNHATNLLNMRLNGAAAVLVAGGDPFAAPNPDAVQGAALANMPFFHISQMSSIYLTNATGSKLVSMYKWDPEVGLDLIEQERISSFGGVPMQINGVFNSPTLEKRDLSSLVSFGFAATTAPPERVKRVETLFGGRVTAGTGYGMTEATSAVTLIGGQEYWDHPDSVGRATPVNEIKIVDDDGNEVPTGQTGELWVRGPNIVQGYWNKPEADARSFIDGWHRSGDVARLDEEGRVYLVDRIKDIVIRAGENVFCGEVEAALYDHPSVHTTAVIGLPHEVLGEEVVAVVRLQDGASTTAAELQEHVGKKLASFKVPSTIIFIDEDVPRTATGKVLKRDLRDQMAKLEGRSAK
ncbi:MAG: AMP-dependent synthetase and ligase [Frankiales bacterium]|nr:AMP-dependent synthetase and ligase [Frankiales bacterium]